MKLTSIVLLLALPFLLGTTKPPKQERYAPSVQRQSQGQTQGQIQGQEASASIGNIVQSGDEVIVDDDSVVNVSTKNERNAPAVYSPSLNPTVPCALTGGFGLSFPGVGGNIGGGKIDKGCEERETARLFAELGYTELALGILCKSKAVERTVTESICNEAEPSAIPVDVVIESLQSPAVAHAPAEQQALIEENRRLLETIERQQRSLERIEDRVSDRERLVQEAEQRRSEEREERLRAFAKEQGLKYE